MGACRQGCFSDYKMDFNFGYIKVSFYIHVFNFFRSKVTKKPRVKVQSLTLPAVTIRQTFNHFCKMRVDKDTLPELVKM